MEKDIKAQKRMAAHAAGFFLELTKDMDDEVFLSTLGGILMTRAGGDVKKSMDLLIRLGSAMANAAKEGEL